MALDDGNEERRVTCNVLQLFKAVFVRIGIHIDTATRLVVMRSHHICRQVELWQRLVFLLLLLSRDVSDFHKQAVNDFKVIGADSEVQGCFQCRVGSIGVHKKLLKLFALRKHMLEDEYVVTTTGEVQ